MSQYSTYKEIDDVARVYSQNKTKCKRCGCTRLLNDKYKKLVCNNCGNYIFLNDKEEFKYRLREAQVREKRKGA